MYDYKDDVPIIICIDNYTQIIMLIEAIQPKCIKLFSLAFTEISASYRPISEQEWL